MKPVELGHYGHVDDSKKTLLSNYNNYKTQEPVRWNHINADHEHFVYKWSVFLDNCVVMRLICPKHQPTAHTGERKITKMFQTSVKQGHCVFVSPTKFQWFWVHATLLANRKYNRDVIARQTHQSFLFTERVQCCYCLRIFANFSGTESASEFILLYTTRFVLCHVHNCMTDMQMYTHANAEMTVTPP